MKTSLVFLVSVSMLGVSPPGLGGESPGDSGKGARFESEWKKHDALDSDYEVVQLTTSKELDNKMYLDVNPYVPSLDSVVFMSERDDGHENLYLMSLEDGDFVQLTDSGDIDGDHANVSPETEEAFFVEDGTFTSVSLRAPYREKKIRTVPDKYDIKGIVALTSDGKTIASSLYDKDENRSSLVLIDVASGELDTVKKIGGDVDHVLINPERGDTLLFHNRDNDGIGLVDIETKNMTLLTGSEDHGVHPFWASAKNAAFAQRRQGDTPEQVVTYNIRKKEFFSYDIEEYSNHFAMNPSQTIIEGDGKDGDSPYIYYYNIEPGTNKVDTVKMFKHRSSSDSESVHPHAAFINETDLIFNSDADGNGNVYLLREK